MKKLTLIVLLTFLSVSVMAQTNNMFIESEAKYNFEETVKLLTETITSN